ncbi:uncharacterized protein MONBRDRAFT_29296 [Monosiga brevicollis MX1]|uniref:t-SNARE coiled-coil homology domain-containing protein n=1 Tax=Monosiga brevicollis TaxID=81824 RepID=A9VAP3_MONBE|nr:uncharacterized protein MONBRDRAFT_29296 [Monosiga brevicollis MX1]EDQ85358.1 predicted protein [Monosiga brevicollis MX1]|eukprot:XP_001749769.1 hypothetical protein [Monosiga brevicollis MX1]
MGAALFRALQSLRAALEGCARDLGTHDGRLRGTGALLVGPERFERQDTLTVVSDTKASLVQLEQALADLRRQLDQQVTSLPNDWLKKANTDTAKPELTNKSLKASGVHPRDGPMATNVGREDPTPASSSDGASDMTPSPAMSQALAQQVRQFRTELHDMAREVDQAQDTLYELASMQSRLMGKLQEQDVTIEQIQQDAETTLHNVDRGNEELTEAIRYNRDFRQGVLLFFIILSLCLLFFDYLSG